MTAKHIALLGFAFKKDTGDTRASPAITIAKFFRDEKAHLRIYDPKVPPKQIWMDITEPGIADDLAEAQKTVTIAQSAEDACIGADAICVLTEWDEFKNLNWQRIYDSMRACDAGDGADPSDKPAFVFDGRLILDAPKLEAIGFRVAVIGKGDDSKALA